MKVLLFANTDWYLFNFRLPLARALDAEGHDVLLVSPPGPYGQRLRNLGFRWIAAPMTRRSLNPAREVGLLLWLHSLIRKEDVDLVHGFTIKCAVYGALAAQLAGVRARVGAVAGMGYVFTSEDLLARSLRPLIRVLMRTAFNGKNARLILQNPDDVALFQRAGLVDLGRIRLIPGSGVDCARFAPGPKCGKRTEGTRFRVVLPARLLWDKGLAEYAAAARLLLSQGCAIDFLLAGEPDQGNPAAVAEPTLRDWVEEGVLKRLGHVDDMAELFRSVDAVVLPSYREGLPKGLIEAAACALPLVTTDVPGCREVVTHEIDGLLVPPKDALALANAIRRLYEDSGLCERLGTAARQKALTQFDERIVVARTLEVYRELLPSEVQHAV